VPAHHLGEGDALLNATREQGLEGVIAKRADSRYEIGRRSTSWRKVKNRRRQEVVVGGWLPGAGNREGALGALLIGHYDDAGRLVYAGRVGTGFSGRELDRLAGLLAPLARPGPPFDTPLPAPVARQGRWVEPRLVAEVEFGEWTGDGVLRHPSYLGLRDDKDPRDVVREPG
jgi:bifunctional non-homologous end joining protein LigD